MSIHLILSALDLKNRNLIDVASYKNVKIHTKNLKIKYFDCSET